MAIKLVGVAGEKLLEAEKSEQTQDFVMADHPVFFIRDLADYVPFSEARSRPGDRGGLASGSCSGCSSRRTRPGRGSGRPWPRSPTARSGSSTGARPPTAWADWRSGTPAGRT